MYNKVKGMLGLGEKEDGEPDKKGALDASEKALQQPDATPDSVKSQLLGMESTYKLEKPPSLIPIGADEYYVQLKKKDASSTKSANLKHGKGSLTPEEYDKLRSKTPNDDMRDLVNKNNPTTEPIYGYKLSKGTRLEADHIVSMKIITQMEGFSELSEGNQVQVLNDTTNFQGLDRRTNASKGPKSWAEWEGHSEFQDKKSKEKFEKVKKKMVRKEKRVKTQLQKKIDERLKSQKKN